MSDRDRIRRDLPRDLEPSELERMTDLGLRLGADRPFPAPGFRGDLGRTLAQAGESGGAPRRRVRALVASCALSGLALLAIAAAGLAGGGPFSPG